MIWAPRSLARPPPPLVLPLAGGAVDWSKAETVMVTGAEYAFTPNHLSFRVGSVYRLRFENRGKELHEFTAPGFFRTLEIRDPASLNEQRTEVVAQPG